MNESEREHLLSRVIAVIGAQRFNHCVESLPDTKQLGRLRYWQESLMDTVLPELNSDAHDYVATFGAFDVFITLFDGERRRPFSVSKTEFVARPIEYYDDSECEFDSKWLDDALNDRDFREHLYGDVVVALSLASGWGELPATRVLHDHLTDAQWVECYNYVNHELAVPENEWRDDFERMFPVATPYLPKRTT